MTCMKFISYHVLNAFLHVFGKVQLDLYRTNVKKNKYTYILKKGAPVSSLYLYVFITFYITVAHNIIKDKILIYLKKRFI